MDSFVTFDKMKLTIYDLLMTEVWKEKVFPWLKEEFTKINSIRSYMAVSAGLGRYQLWEMGWEYSRNIDN